MLNISFLESRRIAAKVVGCEALSSPYRAGKKTAAERTVRNETDPSSRHVARISSSGSRVQSEYSDWIAAMG